MSNAYLLPTEILRHLNETNIGRFAFIEHQTLIKNKKITAAFSHGEPLLNMGTNYDVFPGEGDTNTRHFLKRIGVILDEQHLPLTVFIYGSRPEAIHLTPAWAKEQAAKNGIIETDINFLWGRVDDFENLICLVKTADCLAGMGLGKGPHDEPYFLFFHAGWMQVNGDVIRKGLQQMQDYGCDLSTFHISIGPSISAQSLVFQTKDANTLLQKDGWGQYISQPTDEIDDLTNSLTSFVHVNVGGAAMMHMLEKGVREEHIEWYNPNANPLFNTFHGAIAEHPFLFSHRSFKRGKRNGRNITTLAIQNLPIS